MAQIQRLKDRKSGATIYPMTSTGAVYDNDGRDLETRLASERRATEAALQGKVNAAELAGKQDKLSDSADIVLSGDGSLALTRAARLRLFVDRWNAACGTYGCYDPDNAPDSEHPFFLNDLWLSYEEAVLVMHESQPNELMLAPLNETFAYRQSRTLLPLRVRILYVDAGLVATFISCNNIEVIALDVQGYTGMFRITHFGERAFGGCQKLRKVRGIFYMKTGTANHVGAFEGCKALEEIRIKGLKADLSFTQCPKLSLATLEYIVDNAENTSAITITLHADVYGKITDEGNAEWFALLGKAAAKNISFATI